MRKTLFSNLRSHVFAAFLPWIAFSLIVNKSLLAASLVALGLMVVCNFRELKKGFVLPWGSALFFAFLALNDLFAFWPWAGTHVFMLSNSALAAIVLISMIILRPFTLQYAREEVAQEKWQHPTFIKINWILTSIWLVLMIIMALPSYFLTQDEILSNWIWNYGLSIACIVIGMKCNKAIPKYLTMR
jgi:hypothetical protein